ncbi:MAG: hypothetical protein ABIW47_05565 [Ginsengibacter sp.]|jgi:uncharacterized membrane-anchored protein
MESLHFPVSENYSKGLTSTGKERMNKVPGITLYFWVIQVW